MRIARICICLTLLTSLAVAAEPWQQVVVPPVAEVAAAFRNPPKEYGAIHWAIWGGQQTRERIIADIDKIAASGGGVYMINNSQRIQPKYLSLEYMDLVKTVVAECKKNGMKVWIEGDCGYPDGFAGGIISRDYPQLGMQGIVSDAHCTIAAGQTIDMPLPVDTLGIVVNPRPATEPPASAPAGQDFPLPTDGNFKYTVPRGGAGEIVLQLPDVQMRYFVTVGEPFSIPVPAGTKSITLVPGTGRARGGRGGAAAEPAAPTIIPLPTDGHLKWTSPSDNSAWEITFIRHAFRSSPTRNDNGDDGGATKDSLYTLIDYLNPEATRAYLKSIFEVYEKAVGEEFGKTVLGFRGDETDFTGVIPWTPALLQKFKEIKGYDFQPYIPQIYGGGRLTPEAQRAKADYWDVWSILFRDNFYKIAEQWCEERNMLYMMHLNHEEVMTGRGENMTTNEASFWRDMRFIGVPGVDNLNQIRPDLVADFPKLAASASHLYGRPWAWTEEGGGVGANGKFIIDYQLVRGINYLNIRGMTGARGGGGGRNAAPQTAPADPEAGAKIGWYTTRAGYLLTMGRPAAQVALYHPTDSYWLGDTEGDAVTMKLTTQLMEHQIDFDHIDQDSIASICTLENGTFKNLSGQIYRAVIVPTSTVIQKPVLDRLRTFASQGGKVIFVGRTPSMVADRTFLNAAGAPDLSFATLEPTPEITEKVIAALPKPDVKLDSACPGLKYIHRSLKDGEVYFFFNESDQPQTRNVTLAGSGVVQTWDAATGQIGNLIGVNSAGGSTTMPLTLAAQETRFIVIAPR